MRVFWDFDTVVRGDGERAHAEGTLFLTNIQQLYDRSASATADEPDAMAAVLGPAPTAAKMDLSDFRERIGLRDGHLLVLNDEAHHTHSEDSEWNAVIRDIHQRTAVNLQLDFSATPRFGNGTLFHGRSPTTR